MGTFGLYKRGSCSQEGHGLVTHPCAYFHPSGTNVAWNSTEKGRNGTFMEGGREIGDVISEARRVLGGRRRLRHGHRWAGKEWGELSPEGKMVLC